MLQKSPVTAVRALRAGIRCLPAVTALLHSSLFAADGRVMGQVTDPQGKAVASASLRLRSGADAAERHVSAGADGRFVFNALAPGSYTLGASARDFEPVTRTFPLAAGESLTVNLKFVRMAGRHDAITVTADVSQVDILTPDPAEKVFSSEDLLDANPGRPGAPVSIPGYPIETASSGIKAPQYFAPGVAGDHGEPIAQYIQVGTYLVPNNLSANAHGNGYADPNIYIANVIESVQVDGGAYNVREGNHALNLASIYGLRSHLDPFFTLDGRRPGHYGHRGDESFERFVDRDGGLVRQWIPGPAGAPQAGQDQRRAGLPAWESHADVVRNRILRLLLRGGTAARFTDSIPSMRPTAGRSTRIRLTPDRKDQTHTALMALNDVWKLGEDQEMQLSGFFRTYNLSLFSDFGLGLVRQSEFRTVAGGSAAYRKKFSKNFTLLAGTDYQREAPRRDDLDHYDFYNPADPAYYGPFVKVAGNNVTIAPVSPYIAGEGELSRYVHYYLGWRRDEIGIDNQDLVTPANSWNRWVGREFAESDDNALSGGILVRSAGRAQLREVVLHGRSPNGIGYGPADRQPAARQPSTRWRRHARISWLRASASTTPI